MRADHLQSVMVELTAAAQIQAEASNQRLLFEWGQNMMERVRGVWEHIENLDTLAYETRSRLRYGRWRRQLRVCGICTTV
jgi:hypothetical protein